MEPIIHATGLTRSFQNGTVVTDVLRGVDMTVFAGEFVAIMGKSGAGKSTLMYQLSALDTPSSGTVDVAGVTLTNITDKEKTLFRLAKLGYVFQDYALIPDLSAEENVMLPLLMQGITRSLASEQARKTIDSVGLEGKYQNLPSQLSGGEQQRVSIARAVATKPKIIFADEPTANLDSQSSQTVIDLLSDLNAYRDQTIVMVTHEPEYAKNCNRIFYMEDGKITDTKVQK